VYHFVTTQEVIVKKLFALVAIVLGVLVAAGTAYAGCMATVGLGSTPTPDLAPGQAWFVKVRILQHGRTPMSDARPEIRIRRTNGKLLVFKATPTPKVGTYRARVVVPRAGRYSLSVYDGFPVKECARVHTFGSVVILDPS
jgi:hypothetical protein